MTITTSPETVKETMHEKPNYAEVMPVIKKADRDFTAAHGCGVSYELWDAALESAVAQYNSDNGTLFDPKEARLQYIEQQETENN